MQQLILFMETRLFIWRSKKKQFFEELADIYRFGLDDSLEVFCFPPPENELLSVEEKAACEMYEYYKFWVDCNLHGESFEAYDTTDGRGLRIRATKLVSLGTLSLEMVDFVEIIKYSVCVWLSTRGCPSLHRFFDIITEKWVYGILFGPLALVNTTVGVTFGLYLVIIWIY